MFKFYSLQWMSSQNTKFTLFIVKRLQQRCGPLCWREDVWMDLWHVEAAVEKVPKTCIIPVLAYCFAYLLSIIDMFLL